MKSSDLVLRSLRYFWRTHVGVVLGAAAATAVLVGALAVGDSVRLSLRDQAHSRIGQIDAAVVAHERFFRADLADRVSQAMPGDTVAAALRLTGIVARQGGGSKTGIVDIFGVDDTFFSLSPGGSRPAPGPGQALLNRRLAEQLGVGPGDPILLRVEKPSALPRDMAMATVEDISFAMPAEVGGVVSDEEFGRFSLRASQVPPFNLFVSLSWLQGQLELEERANMLVLGDPEDSDDLVARANLALREKWVLGDAELEVQALSGSDSFALVSDRVFIDQPIAEAVAALEPGLVGVLTYFVNAIRTPERATPYSTVSALGPLAPGAAVGSPALAATTALVSSDPGEDGIVLNDWLARDLQAEIGDRVSIDFFEMGPQLQLAERSRSFEVQAIIPLAGAAVDPELMPPFPGLADSENCRDWEPGIPIDRELIRDVDEEYWDAHRGTPKAFLSLSTGQEIFGNRFGNLTAFRGTRTQIQNLAAELPRQLDPAKVGLFFQDLRGPALAAGTSATDFGGLFLGLSFFLILAALLLTSLLFVFGVEQRANEIGVLLALGFRPAKVRRLILTEALVLAVLGGVIGAFAGMGYTRAVVYGLGSLWQGAVGSATLSFHALPGTVVMGTAIAILTALAAIALTLRKTLVHPAIELLASRSGIPSRVRTTEGGGRIVRWSAVAAPILAVGMVIFAGTRSEQMAGAFFGAGALLLIGVICLCRLLVLRFGAPTDRALASVSALGVRNTGRRAGRSLATIALLASGTFLVVAVQANRLEPPADSSQRDSGTGGFALFGRSTLPVTRDLGTQEGREAYGLDKDQLGDVKIVPMRVRDGDDASCLNLSLPQNPRLVSVDPIQLAGRESFGFVSSLDPEDAAVLTNPWLALDADYGENVVPAIGDAASVTWTLHKGLGDTLDYVDDQGRPFRVRIVGTVANSILQGNLVISEEHFVERFESNSGYRMFLIDAPLDAVPTQDGRVVLQVAPVEEIQQVAANLTFALEDIGLEVTSTQDRLAEFNAVQNTYLLIFQALGGLGLLLGSVGLGMVVLRNALERRSELALTSAVGFPTRAVRQLVWSEHGLLLGLGLASGVVAALLAVLPGSSNLSLVPMALLIVGVAASGAVWVWLATVAATRGPVLAALREE